MAKDKARVKTLNEQYIAVFNDSIDLGLTADGIRDAVRRRLSPEASAIMRTRRGKRGELVDYFEMAP